MPRQPQVQVQVAGLEDDPTFYTGSEHTISITITNPTEWDWVYSVYWYGAHATGDYGFVSEYNSIAAGQSKTVQGRVRMNPVPGTYPSTVMVMEMDTLTTFDLFLFGDITLEEEIIPVPAVQVGLSWD